MYYFIKKILLFSLLMIVCLSSSLLAQSKASISGKVIDEESGDVLRRASVLILGKKIGAYTDTKGEYRILNLPAGVYSIQVSYIGYNTKTIENIELKENQNYILNIVLSSAIKKTDEVVIEARREMNNEAAILAQRKNSSQVSDGISIEEIKRTPDGDAGQSLRRVSGVTLVGDKFVYVRGVSERYNNTTLNGTALATTEPDKKAFSFDMFPADFLQNANVAKSFTPDLPGNFAGGLVQLNTVDFPSSRSFKVSFGTSMTDNLTFNRKFITYNGGKRDWLGFDDGTRELPKNFPKSPQDMRNLFTRLRSDDENVLKQAQNEWVEISRSLNHKSWKRDTIKAPLNGSINMSYSDIYRIGNSEIGIIANALYGNSYSYDEIFRATLESSGNVYNFNRGTVSTFSTNLGGMFNFALKLDDNNTFSIKNTYNNSSDDETTIMLGRKDQVITRQYGFQFVQKTLFATQLTGEHNLSFLNNSFLDWKFGYSNSKRDEPDFKRVRYSKANEDNPWHIDIYDLSGNGYQAGRFFSFLNEDAFSGALNFSLPVSTLKLKTGLLFENKKRDFNVRSLVINKGTLMMKYYYDDDFKYIVPNWGDEDFYNSDFLLEPEEIFSNPDNFQPSRLGIGEETKPTDSYKANENLLAGYLMVDIPFEIAGNKLRVITGARIESSNQKLMSLYPIASNNTDSTFVDESYVDILPSFNLIYQLTNTMNLRLSASQTLTRPSLREYAPFIFYDFYFQGDVAGNPNLKRSLIRNFDLRWEMFPNPGEVISVSLFYKSFKDAIEESVIGTSSNYKRTFANANGLATNYGAELEVRKNLGFISDWTRYFSINFNFALINSDITVRQNNAEDRRTMWGQSPYSLNIGLFYFHPELGTSVNTSYNVAGKRIIQVADITRYPVSDPHVYEMPRNVIDLSVSQTIFNTLDIKFVAKDILNENITWKQMGHNVLSTNKGRSFSFGIGYKL